VDPVKCIICYQSGRPIKGSDRLEIAHLKTCAHAGRRTTHAPLPAPPSGCVHDYVNVFGVIGCILCGHVAPAVA
jgi:hypothetical protein